MYSLSKERKLTRNASPIPFKLVIKFLLIPETYLSHTGIRYLSKKTTMGLRTVYAEFFSKDLSANSPWGSSVGQMRLR